MKNLKYSSLLRYSLLTSTIIAGILTIVATSNQDRQTIVETFRSVGAIMAIAWRTERNSILYLDSDVTTNVAMTIDLNSEPYPPDNSNDGAFYNEARILERVNSTNLRKFILQCGKDGDNALTTTIVFWSEPNWQGTKQQFTCGGTATLYEFESAISAAKSFCIVTELTSGNRRSRCISGPRCDDSMRNGSETDVDCGGSCTDCRDGRLCNSNGDCIGDCVSGRCHTPSCSDGIKNQNESDTDCGGSCNDCAVNRACNGNTDCQSGNCESGICRPKRTCNGNYATTGAANYTVLVRRPTFCGDAVTYFANSLSDARSCAQTAGLTPVSQMCGYYLNIAGDNVYHPYIVAASASDAIACASFLCSNCSFSVGSTVNCVTQP